MKYLMFLFLTGCTWSCESRPTETSAIDSTVAQAIKKPEHPNVVLIGETPYCDVYRVIDTTTHDILYVTAGHGRSSKPCSITNSITK
jgi:hypothetical protein